MSSSPIPAWTSYSGSKRVIAEYRSLNKHLSSYGFLKELSLAKDDNFMVWRLKLHNFDNDVPGGKQLNEDLRRLQAQHGQDHVLLELEFPTSYPTQPFFARVVSPRCVMYTGHVSAGGSICLEALTTSGTAGSWQTQFTVESLMNVIVVNMIDCPVVYIQTPTGPGGMTGPLRVDFSRGNPCTNTGYTSAAARAAFTRTVENHKKMGWSDPMVGRAAAAAAGSGGSSANASRSAAFGTPSASASSSSSGGGSSTGASSGAGSSSSSSSCSASAPATFAVSSFWDGIASTLDQLTNPLSSTPAGGAAAAGAAAAAAVPPNPAALWSNQNANGSGQPRSVVATAANLSCAGSSSSISSNSAASAQQQQQQQQSAWPDYLFQQQSEQCVCRRPRALVEFDYPDSWDHSVPLTTSGVRLVELPLPLDATATCNPSAGSRQVTNHAASANVNPLQHPTPTAGGRSGHPDVFQQMLKGLSAFEMVGISPSSSSSSRAASSRSTYASTRRHHAARRSQGIAAFGAAAAAAAAGSGQAAAAATAGSGVSYSTHSPADPLEAEARRLNLSTADIQLLIANCPFATEQDAKAALLMSDGDLDGAAVIIAMCLEQNGAAHKWREMFGGDWPTDNSTAADAAAGAASAGGGDSVAEEEGAAAVAAEVETLLQSLERSGGGQQTRSKVVKIERVQHPQLWLRFCLKRADIELLRGTAGINEQFLYHGTSSTAVDTIVHEGFDIRVANSGSYGRGTYFSDSSITAFGYCRSKQSIKSHSQSYHRGYGTSRTTGSSSVVAGYKLLVARVALGKQSPGSSGLTKPPVGCDSVHGGGMCHVVFDNHQAYPEYVITLRR